MTAKIYSKDNDYLVERYDSSTPTQHILYLDANILYGRAMSQPLSTGGFQWVDNLDANKMPVDSDKEHMLDVD